MPAPPTRAPPLPVALLLLPPPVPSGEPIAAGPELDTPPPASSRPPPSTLAPVLFFGSGLTRSGRGPSVAASPSPAPLCRLSLELPEPSPVPLLRPLLPDLLKVGALSLASP